MKKRVPIVIDTSTLVKAMEYEMRAFCPSKKTPGNSFNRLSCDRRSPDHGVLLKQASSHAAVSHAFNRHKVCFTEETLDEFARISVLSGDKLFGSATANYRLDYMDNILKQSVMVKPGFPPQICPTDSDDNIILEAAAGAKAHYLVTNDRDLWSMESSGNCFIVKPETYNEIMGLKPVSGKRRELRTVQPLTAQVA